MSFRNQTLDAWKELCQARYTASNVWRWDMRYLDEYQMLTPEYLYIDADLGWMREGKEITRTEFWEELRKYYLGECDRVRARYAMPGEHEETDENAPGARETTN